MASNLPRGIREDWMAREEFITLELRQLYERFGYKKYRMSTFEEYDLYLDNKNFLSDKNIITFNDMNGKVLALKPDVTLSIVKNTRASDSSTEKLYYLEDIYRLDKHSRSYRQISQLGLECFGANDAYMTCEVLRLAALTLKYIGENWIITLSHAGFALKFLEDLGLPPAARHSLTECIRQKNAHQLAALAGKYGVAPAAANLLAEITTLAGDFRRTLERARAISITRSMTDAVDQLEAAYGAVELAGFGDRFRLDFSLVNDIDYYSGIIFQGYAEGVPRPVLSGGYYGSLMKKFGRDTGAMGFAVYLNELARPKRDADERDVDALVLYPDPCDMRGLMEAVDALMNRGLKVRVERVAPAGLTYKTKYIFAGGALEEVAEDA